MAIPTLPAELTLAIKNGDDVPYVPVRFSLGASIYMSALLQTMEDLSREDVRRMLADSILDAAGDGKPYALILTPDDKMKAPLGVAQKLRATWWDTGAKQMRLSDCPARVFGEIRGDDGAVTGFMTLPNTTRELADWIISLGGEASFDAVVN